MSRIPSPQQLQRASRHLVAAMSVVVMTVLLVGFAAFGQNVDVDPARLVDPPKSLLGYIFLGVLALVVAGVTWLGAKISKFVEAKTKATNVGIAETFGWGLVNKAWLKASNIGARLYAKEKALIEKILSDGTVTPEEFKAFRDAIAIDIRVEIQAEIPQLAMFLGGSTGIGSMVEGFATKVANSLLAGQPVPGPVAPVAPGQSELATPVTPAVPQ